MTELTAAVRLGWIVVPMWVPMVFVTAILALAIAGVCARKMRKT